MTDDGHCDHCMDGCSVGEVGMYIAQHGDGEGVLWPPGHCPACAERERIAAFMRMRADWPISGILYGDAALMMVANLIIDGKHLEATDE